MADQRAPAFTKTDILDYICEAMAAKLEQGGSTHIASKQVVGGSNPLSRSQIDPDHLLYISQIRQAGPPVTILGL